MEKCQAEDMHNDLQMSSICNATTNTGCAAKRRATAEILSVPGQRQEAEEVAHELAAENRTNGCLKMNQPGEPGSYHIQPLAGLACVNWG